MDRPARLASLIIPWLVLAAAAGFLGLREPIRQLDSHEGRFYLAIVAMGLIPITAWVVRRYGALRFGAMWNGPLAARALLVAWLLTVGYGIGNYYQFDRRVLLTAGDYSDVTYYYINSKYFDELGYHRLYHAMMVADDEGLQRFRDIPRYRDLKTYERFYSREHALEHAEDVKKHFLAARWEEFRADVERIQSKPGAGSWSYFFTDHGYNPPPVWTLVGGTIAGLIPVSHLEWATAIDIALVISMFVGIYWAFGLGPTLVAMLFFIVTFSGRWPILGQSLLRFDWLAALVLSMCALKKERHGLAGALLVYSALNRIFPAIFFAPYAVWMLRHLVRTRRLAPEHWRFIKGSVGAFALLVIAALWVVGPQAFADSFHNLRMHGGPDSYSSHRVGLGDALVYEGEWSHDDLRESGHVTAKSERLRELSSMLKLLGLVSLVGLAALIWWRGLRPHRAMWLGIWPLFVLTTPQINYYNVRLLPVLAHAELLVHARHQVGLVLLFAIEAATQWVMIQGAARYVVTTTTSIGLLIYLVVISIITVWRPDPR